MAAIMIMLIISMRPFIIISAASMYLNGERYLTTSSFSERADATDKEYVPNTTPSDIDMEALALFTNTEMKKPMDANVK